MPDDLISSNRNVDPGLISRRRMFGLLAAAGAGIFVGTPKASAFFDFFSSYGPAPSGTLASLGIPEGWRDSLGANLPGYAHFLQSLRLRNIKVREIIAPHTKTKGSIKNTLPPKGMWRNIRETLKIIDGLSRRLEMKPEELVSVYRCPAYNARCPGARSNSYHLRNNAIDITFDCSPGKVTAMAKAMRSAGLFRGGVGRYRGFTHIDTRGTNADWRG